MKHPSDEEWMDYLYEELTEQRAQDLKAHLAVCSDCSRKVGAWQETRGALNQWKLPEPVPARAHQLPWMRIAAAAAIILAVGFGWGRASFDTAALAQQIRADVSTEWQEEARTLRQAVAANAAAISTQTALQREDQERNGNTLAALDAQRVADHHALKRQLDTVALATQTALERTEDKLVTLANYQSQPHQ